MKTPLRVLLVEDSDDDSVLILNLLSRAGYEIISHRVQTAEGLREALHAETWSIVISDYCMPSFDAPAAIRIVQERGDNVPLIVVSGTVGEEVAVETLKLGADDYLLKQNLTRLVPAVERAIQVAEGRRRRQELEHMKSIIMSNSLDMICTLDGRQNFLEVSNAAKLILGLDPAEMAGRAFADFVVSEDLESTRAELVAVRNGRQTKGFENRCLHRSGEIKTLVWSAVWSQSDNAMIVVGRDVTEGKRIEEALREETAMFEALVESALDGILVVDATGKHVIQNRRMQEIWKIPPHIAASGNDVKQLDFVVSRLRHPREFLEKVRHLYAHPDEVSRDEIVFIDGTILDRYSAPVQDKSGKYYGRIWTFRDVTNERSREEKLAKSLSLEKEFAERARAGERAKSEFLAVMSHEVRTPLNGILGFAELLAEAPSLTPEYQGYSRTIVQSGEALLRILDDILDFSRLEAGRLQIVSSIFSPRALLEDIRNLVARQASEKGLALHVSVAPPIPEYLEGDSGRIRQILLNLVGNALKFTERGHVSITLSSLIDQSSTFVFVVSDTGPGIAPENVQKIFQPFTQADSSIARRHGGTGLGLSISQRLTKLLNGDLSVKSQLGQGTVFSLALPLRIARHAPRETAPHPGLDVSFATAHPFRVLVAEDEPVNLKLIQTLIKRLGYEPLTAKNGREAVKIFRSEKPDFILMDLQMPEMDGTEATRAIRAQEQQEGGPPVFIAALTANIFPADKQKCLDAGMDDYLNKPVKPADLARVLARACENRALTG